MKRLAQLVVIGAALLYLVRIAQRNADQLADARLTIDWLPLLAGSLLTLLGYACNVRLWSWSLGWWRQRLAFVPALRIWFLSNLARFIPGVVWQFAGLAAMSHAQGVSPVAATAAVIVQQVALLVTGLLASLALAPELFGAWAEALPAGSGIGALATSIAAWSHGLPLAVRILVVLGLFATGVLLVPVLLRAAARLWARWGRGSEVVLPSLSIRDTALYVAAHLVPWALYGVAFHLFADGVLAGATPSLGLAAAAFISSYVAGIIVVIAPAGLGVREVVLYAALRPAIGPGDALLLSLLSRVWLVATELAGALIVLVATRTRKREPAPR
jgi:hypothetical protein